METLSFAFNNFRPILRSLVTFPSCVFWIAAIIPTAGWTLAYTYYISRKRHNYGLFLTTSLLADTNYRCFIIFSQFGRLLAFIRISLMVQHHYRRVIRNAAPAAKRLIKMYLLLNKVSTFLIVLFNCGFLLVRQGEKPTLHYTLLILFFVFNLCFTYCIIHLNRIKRGEMYTDDYIMNVAIIILMIVGIPLHLYELKRKDYFSVKYTISCVLVQAIHVLFDIKYLILGYTILDYKFVKFEEYLP